MRVMFLMGPAKSRANATTLLEIAATSVGSYDIGKAVFWGFQRKNITLYPKANFAEALVKDLSGPQSFIPDLIVSFGEFTETYGYLLDNPQAAKILCIPLNVDPEMKIWDTVVPMRDVVKYHALEIRKAAAEVLL